MKTRTMKSVRGKVAACVAAVAVGMLTQQAVADNYFYKQDAEGACCWDGKVWYYTKSGNSYLTSLSYTGLRSHDLSVNRSTEEYPLRITNGIAAVASTLSIGTSFVSGYSPVVRVESGGSLSTTILNIGGASSRGRLLIEGSTVTVSGTSYVGGVTSDGFSEIVLSNAAVKLTHSTLGDRLFVGYGAGAWGVMRGWGTITGGAKNANMTISRGQVVADGFGEQKTLDFGSLANVKFDGDWSLDATNGWYAVNKGKVQFPRVWRKPTSKDQTLTGCCGDVNSQTSPSNQVNGVGFAISGFGSTGERYFRCALYAEDRTDVHLDSLPENNGIVGVWSMRFDDGKTYCSVNNINLTFHFDPAKARTGSRLALYRWGGSAWVKVATGAASSDRLFSVSGLASLSQSENIGTFALVKKNGGLVIFVE